MQASDVRILAGIAVVMIVATYAKYVLGWSIKDLIVTVSTEFRELLKLQPTPGAINAASLLCALLLTVAGLVSPKFERLLSLGGAIPNSASLVPLILGSALFLAVAGLICARLVKEK